MNFEPDPEFCEVLLIGFQLLGRGFLLGVRRRLYLIV
jgi:hypothetical protein